MTTVLSGLSGNFRYKPGGTTAIFTPSDIIAASKQIFTLSGEALVTLSGQILVTGSPTGGISLGSYSTSVINVGTGFNFKPGDPIKFRLRNVQSGQIGSGTLPSPLSATLQYYVVSYDTSIGLLAIASDSGLTQIVDFNDNGFAANPNKFEVYYSDYSSVSEIRSWSLEISRTEIDATSIGKSLGQYFASRSYISGYGDASGTVTVYLTESDAELSNRMLQDLMLVKQNGAAMKLYVDYIEIDGYLDEVASRSIEIEAVLTSASLNVNPDDGQSVDISFRPSGLVDFDFSAS